MNDFIFSQNSINTYKSCPLKFKYKYVDKINWRKDDLGSREYYESLRVGSEFHLICERYFSNIPLGVNETTNVKFTKWIEKIKKILPVNLDDNYIYLPEYEIRYKLNDNIITAKYDLVIIKDNKVEIWDWKTENKRVDYKNAQNRIQTIVYMYLAKEVIPKLYSIDINFEDITMKYYQPEFEDVPITISYSEQMHDSYGKQISNYINMIKDTHTHNRKNENHCKFCEFNKLCNVENIKYQLLEEENYEC